ncbi:Os05g0170425 [Oryza sativa Japonica Group]|uniref:Os05g0170425 protein n=1 Tax=Oryza sativa subsp. japonica TaxID=39947 RepID=A0A0P0WIR3_ORYSJ|nr:Os05g0170425 [Oryza sativa Japonica Group]
MASWRSYTTTVSPSAMQRWEVGLDDGSSGVRFVCVLPSNPPFNSEIRPRCFGLAVSVWEKYPTATMRSTPGSGP